MPDTHSSHRALTMANEDYLESIYRLATDGDGVDGVRSVDVAEQLGVSKASVNKALSTLREAGLVEQNRYGRVNLTDAGRTYAADVWKCHRMIRTFLVNELGVDMDTADAEACEMEHAISHDTMVRWMAYMQAQGVVIDD